MERPRSTGARQVEAWAGCTASTEQIRENLAARVLTWIVGNCLLSALMLSHHCSRLQWCLDGLTWEINSALQCSLMRAGPAFIYEAFFCVYDVNLRTSPRVPWHKVLTAGITLRNAISYNLRLRLVLVNWTLNSDINVQYIVQLNLLLFLQQKNNVLFKQENIRPHDYLST